MTQSSHQTHPELKDTQHLDSVSTAEDNQQAAAIGESKLTPLPSRLDDKKDVGQKVVSLDLPVDVLFAFDWRKKLPVLIDTGAAISIFPLHLCEEYDQDEPVTISGVLGSSQTVGSITYSPEFGFKNIFPQKFYVANVNINFIIAGVDFLAKNQLSVHPHLKLLKDDAMGDVMVLI